jgi:DNA-binding transcriptional ArsR family regulator
VPTATPVRLAEVAQLIAYPGRARILSMLFALTASELALVAGVTPQTMSSHPSKMVDGGLLAVDRRGRRHFLRFAGPLIARMLACMMLVAGTRSRG